MQQIVRGLEHATRQAHSQEYMVELWRWTDGQEPQHELIEIERHFPRQRYTWHGRVRGRVEGQPRTWDTSVVTVTLPEFQLRKTEFQGAAYAEAVPENYDIHFLMQPGQRRPADPMLLAINGEWGGRTLLEVLRGVAAESPERITITPLEGGAAAERWPGDPQERQATRRVRLVIEPTDEAVAAGAAHAEYVFQQMGEAWVVSAQHVRDQTGEPIFAIELEYHSQSLVPTVAHRLRRRAPGQVDRMSMRTVVRPERHHRFRTDAAGADPEDRREVIGILHVGLVDDDHVLSSGGPPHALATVLPDLEGNTFFFYGGRILGQDEYLRLKIEAGEAARREQNMRRD